MFKYCCKININSYLKNLFIKMFNKKLDYIKNLILKKYKNRLLR